VEHFETLQLQVERLSLFCLRLCARKKFTHEFTHREGFPRSGLAVQEHSEVRRLLSFLALRLWFARAEEVDFVAEERKNVLADHGVGCVVREVHDQPPPALRHAALVDRQRSTLWDGDNVPLVDLLLEGKERALSNKDTNFV